MTIEPDAWNNRYYSEKRQDDETGQIAREKISRFEEISLLLVTRAM
jgi:hypothetical protein